MSLPVRRRYDTESLLEVAVAVFTERGYDGTSMEDLARASGLSKSSLYHHIDSKEQLLRLALERAVEPLFAVTRESGATSGRAIERLAPRGGAGRRGARARRRAGGGGARRPAAVRDAAAAGARQHRGRALGAGAAPGL